MLKTYCIAAFMVGFFVALQIQGAINDIKVKAYEETAYQYLIDPSPSSFEKPAQETVEEKPRELTVYEIIEVFFGNKADQAKAVVKCESGFQPTAKSKISSASGLFQIIRGTWIAYKCDGDPLNPVDNTRCAKKIYDNNRSWKTSGGWEASYHCHLQP